MKNTFLKTFGSAILMMMAFAQISVSAQNRGTEEEDSSQAREVSPAPTRPARALEGVWNVQVTRLNCQTGAVIAIGPAILTYARGGTMHDFGTGRPPTTRSPGYGVWSYQSNRQYTSAFQFFVYNTDGTLAGRQVARQQLTLSHDGNSFTTTGTAQVFDVNGNVVMNNCSTSTATRFQ